MAVNVLILSSHPLLGFPSDLCLSGLPTKSLYAPFLPPIRATCLAYLFLLHSVTRITLGELYRSLCSSLGSLLHSPVTSSLLGPNIFLTTPFSKTLGPFSSLKVRAQLCNITCNFISLQLYNKERLV